MGCCEKYKEISEFLINALECEKAKGVEGYCTQEAGEITDQIKDMEQAMKYHYEALYYKLVCMSMLGVDSEEVLEIKEVMGYNHRHLNNGEFASAGRGHRVMGYNHPMNPMMKEQEFTGAYLHNPEQFRDGMRDVYGYDHDSNMNSSNRRGNNMMSNRSGYDDRRWEDGVDKAYDEYRNAKRHYHETGDQSSKKRMEEQFLKSLEELGEVGLDIYDDADPMMQRKVREVFEKFSNKTKA